ncbi:hypothetical protein [Micromonospora okii]|uniref:hypothetical protein n=1 Tax=Micromonospora okii TaxID=1182970 RepID=UPI001E3EE9AD|nr:hypothetical protein [Micromonospora okii]
MEPVTVIPACQMKFFDGENIDEITTWLQTVVTDTYTTATQVHWGPGGDPVWLSHNYWICATFENPPRVIDQVPDEMMRLKYALPPGPITLVPPLSELRGDEPGNPGPVTP